MGYLALTGLFLILQSSLSEQMNALRKELNHVSLEQKNVQRELEAQAIFLKELREESAKLQPRTLEARERLLKWLNHLPAATLPSPVKGLPLPTFSRMRNEELGVGHLIQEELERTYHEYLELQRHWRESEEQVRATQIEIETKKRYLVDLGDNLRAKIDEKDRFRKRLLRSPSLLGKLKDDYELVRKSLDRVDFFDGAEERMEQKGSFSISLPVQGEVFRGFGNAVNPRYQTVIQSRGVHIKTLSGQEVAAVLPGEVVFVGSYGLFGQLVMIRHHGGVRTLYSGFSRVFVEQGQKVNYRQALGLSGHGFGLEYEGVYFEVRRGRRAIDPLQWLRSKKVTL